MPKLHAIIKIRKFHIGDSHEAGLRLTEMKNCRHMQFIVNTRQFANFCPHIRTKIELKIPTF